MADRYLGAPHGRREKLYLCAVKHACSKRIVGYSIDARMTSELAVTALRNAVALRGPAETIVHSDRGSQFRSHAYQRELRATGLRGSMGRVGTCADNAAMESFFAYPSRLRNRVVHGYWSVDMGVLHTTASEQLGEFVQQLRVAATELERNMEPDAEAPDVP